jgi:hypothetical protein
MNGWNKYEIGKRHLFSSTNLWLLLLGQPSADLLYGERRLSDNH